MRCKLVFNIALVFCCSHQLQAKPQDVHFQSKMPSNWLTIPPITTESLELQLMRLVLAHSSELTPHFHLVNFTKASELTHIQADSCMASILKNPTRQAEFIFSRPLSAIEGLKLYIPRDSELIQQTLLQYVNVLVMNELEVLA